MGVRMISSGCRETLVCMCRYEKPLYSDPPPLSSLSFSSSGEQLQQLQHVQCKHEDVYKFLYKWRDDVARKEDESLKYVLPTHMLLDIADKAPSTVKQL